MNLEPLPPELAQLRDRLPSPSVSPEMKARVWARVASSGAALPLAAATAGRLGAWGLPTAVGALLVGTTAGVALDRAVLAPRVTVEVRREVVVPVAEPVPVPVQVPPLDSEPPAVVLPRTAPLSRSPSGEERQLIEAARTALLKRSPTAALQAITRHRQRFPRGQLEEERDSLEVQALMQAGEATQARAAALAFLKKFPQSVFGPAVEAALGDAPD